MGTLPGVLITGGTPTERWRLIGHLLACRSGQCCESCGKALVPGSRELSIHHRQARGMGGTPRVEIHDLSNLLLLCAGRSRRLAGVLGCHGRAEAHLGDPVGRGLIVPWPADPVQTVVVLASGRRVLLDPDAPAYLPPPDGLPYAV